MCNVKNVWYPLCSPVETKVNSAGDWKLSPSSFMTICLEWSLQVDVFASEWNRQLPKYVSWSPQPNCWKVDAFSFPCKDFGAFCFPPFNMIPFCLSKLIEEEAEAVLITPYWRSQPWFPVALDIAVAAPRLLRPCPDLLTSPTGDPLVANDSIWLIAWRFRRRLSKNGVSDVASSLILSATRRNTNAAYQSAWNSGGD